MYITRKKEEADERTLLYQAMQKLIVEFLGNNPWDALKISVVDTVNSASDLGKAASEELLDIYAIGQSYPGHHRGQHLDLYRL